MGPLGRLEGRYVGMWGNPGTEPKNVHPTIPIPL
jgi:hypothetical protein